MGSFQPRFGEIQYATGKLVIHRANLLFLSRRDVVARIGYKCREAKGHQMLSAFMAGENLSVPFLDRLPNVLEIEPSTLDAALLATVLELDAEAATRTLAAEEQYRRSFQPHLQVRCERRIPSPIFAAAMIGVRKLRVVELPDGVTSMGENVREEIVRDIILCHHREHRGMVPCFGEITGYVLVLVPGYADQDFGIPFDCRGRRIGSMTTVPRLLNGRLGKRRPDGRLNGLLKGTLVQVAR